MRHNAKHTIWEADGHHDAISVRIDRCRLEHNHPTSVEWADGTKSMCCWRVSEE